MATTYAQFCPVARALEIVGERWTLLIARELLFGPRRFTDLQVGLPGISTTVLTSRLKELDEAGLVAKRTLPPPAASVVYELTDAAWGLASVMATMAEWGRTLLGAPRPGEDVRSAWLILGLAVTADTSGVPDAAFELRIDGSEAEGGVFTVTTVGGHCQPQEGPATNPTATVSMTHGTLLALASGALDAGSRSASRRFKIEGDVAAGRRFVEAIGARASSVAGRQE